MKVKELVELLQEYDPNDEVIVYDPDEDNYYKPSLEKYKGYACLAHYYGKSEQVDDPEELEQ